MRALRVVVRLAGVLAAEAAALVLLLRLGDRPWAVVGWSDPLTWAATVVPGDAVVAVGRLVALAGTGWLTATTLLAVAVRVARVPAAVRAADRVTLPAVRRLADRAVAVALATGTLAAPGVAVADPGGLSDGGQAAVAAPDVVAVPVVGPGALPGLPPLPADPAVPTAAEPGAGDAAAPDPTPAPTPPDVHVVVPGDNLWRLAAQRVAAARGTDPAAVPDRDVHAYWVRVLAANADTIPSRNPDLIHPGDTVLLPPG